MNKSYTFLFLAALLLFTSTAGIAAPSFDTANLTSHLKDLVGRESRNKFMKYASEYVETANQVMATIDSAKKIAGPLNIGTTKYQEWSPVVPKNVAVPLKEKSPDLGKVKAEIEKIVFIDMTTPETLRRTKRQQGILLIKILSYSYAAAERSLELSEKANESNEDLLDEINSERDLLALHKQLAQSQMYTTMRVTEILNLQSRMLEIDSMLGLMNKEKEKKRSNDQNKSTETPKK